MENAVAKTSSAVSAREISVITQEIRQLCMQAQTTALMYIVEIGRRLVEAKEALPHGEWGNWLKSEVGFSQSTANNYMKLFEEYGASQITIFGATVNSQSFANLPYSKALALLAVERDERERFAEEVDAESLSTSELKAAIRERDIERERNAELAEKYEEAVQRRIEAEAAADGHRDLEKKVKELEGKLTDAKASESKLKDKIRNLKENPKIPDDMLDDIKTDAMKEAQKELAESIEKELSEARENLAVAEKAKNEAERARLEAEEGLKRLKKELKTANPEINRFKILFEALQDAAAKCRAQIEKIRAEDEEAAKKLVAAMMSFADGIYGG